MYRLHNVADSFHDLYSVCVHGIAMSYDDVPIIMMMIVKRGRLVQASSDCVYDCFLILNFSGRYAQVP